MKRAEQGIQKEGFRKSVPGVSIDEEKASIQTQQKKQKRKRNSCPLSYIEVISYAILSSPRKRVTLSDIYSFIQNNYPEFTENRVRWKNTVRHNLSIHECFQRGEMALDKSGCYWRIHPRFFAHFSRGDFSRHKEPQNLPCAWDGGYSLVENPAFSAPCPVFPYRMCEPPSPYHPHVGVQQYHNRGIHAYGQHPYFTWNHFMY